MTRQDNKSNNNDVQHEVIMIKMLFCVEGWDVAWQ